MAVVMQAEASSVVGKRFLKRKARAFSLFLLRRCLFPSILALAITNYCSGAAQVERSVAISNSFPLESTAGSGWMFADLDGDRTPDLAMARRVGYSDDGYLYRIELRRSSDPHYDSFTVSHSDTLGLKITGIDIDADHDTDLVIGGRFSGEHIGVWINDGNGHFAKSPPGLFSSTSWVDVGAAPINPDANPQAFDLKVHRRLIGCLRTVGYVRSALFIGFAS